MPNRLDNGISITMTYKEAVAVLRAMADAEIDTGLGLESAAAALDAILDGPVRELQERAG